MVEIVAVNETLQQIVLHVLDHRAIGVTLWYALGGLEVKRKRASGLLTETGPSPSLTESMALNSFLERSRLTFEGPYRPRWGSCIPALDELAATRWQSLGGGRSFMQRPSL